LVRLNLKKIKKPNKLVEVFYLTFRTRVRFPPSPHFAHFTKNGLCVAGRQYFKMNLVNLLFPKKCLACGKDEKYVCAGCLGKVKAPKAVCPECLKASIDGAVHAKCLKPQGLDGFTSLWEYDGVIRKAILALKYRFAYEIADELGLCSMRAVGGFTLPKDAVLVPVPLYWLRKNWRGFNQSEMVGKAVAQKLGWEFAPDLLVRRQMKIPQTELKRDERLQNAQGVFVVSRNIDVSQYRCIVLFDDVWTTGSTLKEAAKVLKKAGAKKVWGLTLAKGIS